MYLNNEDMNPNSIYWGFDGDIPYSEICMALNATAQQFFGISFQEMIKGDAF